MTKQKVKELLIEYFVIALIFIVSGAVFLVFDWLDTKCNLSLLYYIIHMFVTPLIILLIFKINKYEET